MSRCLYLTENKPSRKGAREFIAWLKDNHPACSFTEVNAERKAVPAQHGGRYMGRVDAPAGWGDADAAAAVFAAARRLLAD